MAKDYAVRLKCPYQDGDVWLPLWDCEETLEQILSTAWDFECPVHGVHREIPVEAREIPPSLASGVQPIGLTEARKFKTRRRSRRVPLRVPVLVYGRNRNTGAFHEETSTDLVNARGGRVALTARVALGETVLVVNKATQQEQECRVAYVGPREGAKSSVGIAFQHSAPRFWGVDFPLHI
jgi:hypothetical protein